MRRFTTRTNSIDDSWREACSMSKDEDIAPSLFFALCFEVKRR